MLASHGGAVVAGSPTTVEAIRKIGTGSPGNQHMQQTGEAGEESQCKTLLEGLPSVCLSHEISKQVKSQFHLTSDQVKITNFIKSQPSNTLTSV